MSRWRAPVCSGSRSTRFWKGTSRSLSATPSTSATCRTDIKDAEWLGQLLRLGLIRASFVPPPEFRELRELLRFRRGMVQEPAQSDDPAPGGSRHQAGGGGERCLRGGGGGHAEGTERRYPEPGGDGRSDSAADARQAAGPGAGARRPLERQRPFP